MPRSSRRPHRCRVAFARAARFVLCGALEFLAAAPAARAALAKAPHEDIDFIAEHAAEAPQDARFFALAWPVEPLRAGSFDGGVDLGWNQARAGSLRVRGTLASLAGIYSWRDRRGVALLAFSDQFSIGGGTGREVLRSGIGPALPLDLPERVELTRPRGDVRQFGVGVGYLAEAAGATTERARIVQAGLLFARLEVADFALDYRLLGGADAGARGTLVYSTASNFAIPYAGLAWRRPLGRSFLLVPHVAAGVPLPAGEFHRRTTGPGFDVSSRSAGRPGKIGDGFAAAGALVVHRSSGLAIDLGAALAYPLFEAATHPGIERGFLVRLGWRPVRR